MIDRMKGSIEIAEVKELRVGSISAVMWGNSENTKNPKNSPVVYFHNKMKQFVFDVAVPRALFGNNLEEAKDEDLERMLLIIQEAFNNKGLGISLESIANSNIYYVEYGKNIILPLKYCLAALFNRLNKCLVKGFNHLEYRQYIEDGIRGYKLGIVNDGRDISFYDKTSKEIVGKSPYNAKNKCLYEKLLSERKRVLRYEITFYRTEAIKRYLSKFKKINGGFRLKDIWDSHLINQVLVSYWNEIEDNLPASMCPKEKELRQLDKALKEGVPLADAVMYKGLEYYEQQYGATVIKQLCNPIEARYKGNKSKAMQYNALKKKQKNLKTKFDIQKEYVLTKVGNAIKQFNPIRLDSTKQEAL